MSLEVYTTVGEQGIYHCPKTSKLKLFIVHHACHGGDGRIYLKINVTTIKKRKKKTSGPRRAYQPCRRRVSGPFDNVGCHVGGGSRTFSLFICK